MSIIISGMAICVGVYFLWKLGDIVCSNVKGIMDIIKTARKK